MVQTNPYKDADKGSFAPMRRGVPTYQAADAGSLDGMSRKFSTGVANPYGNVAYGASDPLGRGDFGGMPAGGRGWESDDAYSSYVEDWYSRRLDSTIEELLNSSFSGNGGVGGGGTPAINYSQATANLMNSGLFNPVAVPELQGYQQPQAYMPQQWDPTMIDPSQLQQWTPEMLAAPDFSGQYANIDAMGQQVRDQIGQAYDPAIAALSQPLQTAIGSVQGAAQQLSPELGGLAGVMGIDQGYSADLASANQGIQSNADLFTGRNQMLDRVFANNQVNNANIAQQSRAGALSGASVQEMLARAGLDRIAQNAAMETERYNNGLTNQAGQYNSGLMNDAYLQNISLGNQAGQFNTGVANDAMYQNTDAFNQWLNSNTDLGNQQALLGFENDQAANTARQNAILEMIYAAAQNGQQIDPSVYGMVA